MKKIYYVIFSLFISIFYIGNVSASNKINNIDIDIYINEDGSANIKEIWQVSADSNTEFYKPMTNLGNMSLSNFTVRDEDNTYTYLNSWDVNGSLSSKAYKNGINYIDNGFELCWGISSYGKHTYTINYTLSNFIFNTDDYQVTYYKFINDNMNPNPKNFTVKINSFYTFPDSLDVWGYGYDGYAYVDNGIIELANKENNFKSSHYGVVLIKFPLNTFNNKNSYSQYKTFDSILNKAEDDATKIDNRNNNSSDNDFFSFFPFLIFLVSMTSGVAGAMKLNKYQFKDKGAKIKTEEIQNFRDIPVNKDIYMANTITKIYVGKNKIKDNNIIGAVLLKWILFDKVSIVNLPNKMFKKDRVAIDLKDIKNFENDEEKELYDIMKEASKDNILEANELKSWSNKNYTELFDWIKGLDSVQDEKLVTDGYLNKLSFGRLNVSPNLKPIGLQVLGLKKFLEDFSNIKDKSIIEVKLWREYLMFAQVFGIADKVAKQFKELIPEVFEYENYDVDTLMHNIVIINMFSTTTVSAANAARNAAANNYSGGGGGFSSFGGGGGSFGGGSGGGSR